MTQKKGTHHTSSKQGNRHRNLKSRSSSRSASQSNSHVLTDHDEILQWAEEREACPAKVKGTGSSEDLGMIRIDFPKFGGKQALEPISWEEFFVKFDESGLALLVQEETASGERSNFNKLVKKETAKKKAA